MAELKILNPVAQVSVRKSSLAPRLPTLDNKRIGLFWNGKWGGDIAMTRISQLLEGQFRGVQFKLIKSNTPGPKESLEEAKTFDAVIGATGD